MRVFLDTNILLDVIARRQPFYEKAARICDLVEAGKIDGIVAAVSIPTVFYLTRRVTTVRAAYEALGWIEDLFVVAPCDADLIHQAAVAKWKDFEDAVQYFSARRAGAACLITRDEAHFESADIPILSPEAFLRSLSEVKE
jgi:predicted nucleic acid-binding protein